MPSKALSFETPLDMLVDSFPRYRYFPQNPFKIFQSSASVYIRDHKRGKFDPRTVECIFLGYSPTPKGYKCFDTTTRTPKIKKQKQKTKSLYATMSHLLKTCLFF